ncbi:hypothetical protein LXA43DRAFT_895717 [Ganoderma leucocontextum]|nr:hypothetical protein LXA43DRAFT_895717 [Ganoderma leucocontextum]
MPASATSRGEDTLQAEVTSPLSPYAIPAVTGYGVSAQTLPSLETNIGRHSSVASYYAPSTSSGQSRADFPSPSTSSSPPSAWLPEDRDVGIARSCSTSTTHTTSSGASHSSQQKPPSDSGAAADGPWHPQSQRSPHSASTRGQSFGRAPPHNLPYGPFPPATLHAYSDDLQADGFPKDPPTCACAPAPHPFVMHDVNEQDWAGFLDDVRSAGGLSPVSGLIAGAAPVAVRAGIIGGLLAGHALRAHMKTKRKSPVADAIDEWNRKFFHPRCMDVVLAQGTLAYTGPANALPPDVAWRAKETGTEKHVKAYEDTSDDENDPRVRVPGMAAVDSMGRQLDSLSRQLDFVSKPARRDRKRGRIALSRDLKTSAGERWRLVVSYNPPVL